MAFTPMSNVFCQVEWKDPLVVSAIGDQTAASVARPSQTAFTIVVWQDERHGSEEPKIFMQRISNATGLPAWLPSDGIEVCPTPGAQLQPRAAYDTLGGVIVSWIDGRNGALAAVYAQRFDATTGEQDPAWPPIGTPVRELDSPVEHVRLVGNGDGAYITWLDHRFCPGGSTDDRRVFVQYILSATASWPQGMGFLWAQDGIQVTDANYLELDQEHPELARDWNWQYDANNDYKTGCVITYQQLTTAHGMQPYWNVWATNIDANGASAYANTDIPLGAFASDQLYPRIVCAGAEPTRDLPRAIVVWQDSRQDPNVPYYDIMCQVLDDDGNHQFTPQGEIICDEANTQRRPVPALYERPYSPTGYTPYIPYVSVIWEDLRDVQTTGVDIYGATLDARFLMLVNPSGPVGEVISQNPGAQTNPALDHIGTSDVLNIAWEHPGPGGGVYANSDIHHQKVTIPSWFIHRPMNGWPVTEAKGDQVLPEVSGEVFVFQDRRRQPIINDNRDDWDIRSQTSGECVGPTDMRWRDMWAKVTNLSDAQSYRMTTDDERNVFVVWDEIRYPNEGRQVYIQKFDKDGVPRWTFGGVQVSNVDPALPTDEAKLADVAIDGNYGAQVVWQQTGPATEQVVYAHVPYDGAPASFSELAVAGTLGMLEPRIVYMPASTRNGGWGEGSIVVAIDSTASTRGRVLYRMEAVGAVVLREQTVPLGGNGIPYYYGLEIVSNGDGGVHILSRAEQRTPPTSYFINVTTMTELSNQAFDPSPDEGIQFTEFHGYDIAADLAWPAPHRPMMAYAIALPGLFTELVVSSYGTATASAANRILGIPWPDGGIATASQPAIVADNYDLGNVGGMLLAWNQEYVNAQWQVRNRVLSEHVYFSGIYYGVASNTPMVVSMDLTEKTWPDIARVEDNLPGQEPLGMVVWEGGGETSSCSPPRPTEIYTQLVGYEIGVDRGLYWTQEMMVAPGPGNYHQRRPTVQPSDDGTFTVFWLDSWGGTASPMGTRMYHIDANAIGWRKDRAPVPPEHIAVSVYPNPLVAGGALTLQLENASAQQVRVLITDALGGTIATVHDGVLAEGMTTLQAVLPRGQLSSGTYFVTVFTRTGRSVTSFIVFR
jgi:hypothetical protein